MRSVVNVSSPFKSCSAICWRPLVLLVDSTDASTEFKKHVSCCATVSDRIVTYFHPGGGHVRIETVKLDFKEKAQAKVGSLDNAHHTPGGGSIMVSVSSPVNWKFGKQDFEKLLQI